MTDLSFRQEGPWQRSLRQTRDGSYLSTQYHRLRPRRGSAKATVAVEHSILIAAYHMLDRRQPYSDLGNDWFVRRHDPERHARRLARQITALGFDVTITPAQAA